LATDAAFTANIRPSLVFARPKERHTTQETGEQARHRLIGFTATSGKAPFLWQKFPKFVLGFLLVSALATSGAFTKAQAADLANLSRWAFLLTFAGVGLETNLRELRKQGLRPLVVGAIGEFAIAAITLLGILGASKSLGLL
jgi:uncharacterized membrane protein YadS